MDWYLLGESIDLITSLKNLYFVTFLYFSKEIHFSVRMNAEVPLYFPSCFPVFSSFPTLCATQKDVPTEYMTFPNKSQIYNTIFELRLIAGAVVFSKQLSNSEMVHLFGVYFSL